MYDSLLFCDKILLYKKEEFVCEDNIALGVKEGRIAYLGPPTKALTAKKIYRLKDQLISPGFVNTHTHLPMSLFRGLADNLSLQVWLEKYIFPLEAKLLKEDFIRAGVKLALIELIQSGITTCCDMYFYNQAIADTLSTAGLRAYVGLGIPSVEKDWPEWKQKSLALRSKWAQNPRIKIALAPHAPYTLSTEILSDVAQFAKKEDFFISIHVSESLWEQKEINKKYQKTPVQYLHSLGLTSKNSLFVHCVHVNEQDLETLSQTGTSLSYNPESNMKLGNGIAPIGMALQKGVTVGLGTDGSASNNNLNFFEEMGTGAKLQALKYGDQSLTAQEMFKMATIEGAKALNWDHEIGSLEVGKKADLIALDLNSPAFYPLYNPISSIVYSAIGKEVQFVMCEGQVIMQDYQIQTLDQKQVLKDSQVFSNKIQNYLSKS